MQHTDEFADCDDSGAQTHRVTTVDLADAYDMLCDALAKLVSGFSLRLEAA